jgi:hypothetical protein
MVIGEIEECLQGDGWVLERLSETTLRSRFRGASRVFPLFVHVDDLFVTFAIIPFAKIAQEVEEAESLFYRLLRLNREVNLARFSLDSDGDVILSVEYKIEDLDPSEVRDAVDVLSFYADKFHPEIAALTSDSAASSG